MTEVLLDALLDTLKLFPWLLLIYIVIELIEHKTKLTGSHNRLSGRLGPLIGSATGLVPQCGFSVMAAKLFEQKYITVGTLLAIFVSTSDEAFILLLSSGRGAVWLLPLIALKIAVGIAVGYAVDGVLKLVGSRRVRVRSSAGEALDAARAEQRRGHEHGKGAENECGHGHGKNAEKQYGHGHGENLEKQCGRDGAPEEGETKERPGEAARELFLKKAGEKEFECTSCGREHDENKPWKTYFLSPFLHSLKIAAFILAVNLVLGVIIYYVTEERFMAFMKGNLAVQPLIASLVGLIPNCASSVVITESFLQGGISFGSCAAGLCANAGLGFVVLLKNTKEWKRNLALIAAAYVVAGWVGFAVNAVFPAYA